MIVHITEKKQMLQKFDKYEHVPCAIFIKWLKVDIETFITELCSPLSIVTEQHSDLINTDIDTLQVVKNGEWTLFLDDLSFTLYSKIWLNNRLEALLKEYDVFYFLLGDAFDDYTFAYYKNGIKVRKVDVQDNWDHGILRINDGESTPVEIPLVTSDSKKVSKMIWDVAAYYGIDTSLDNVKCYRWVKGPESNQS